MSELLLDKERKRPSTMEEIMLLHVMPSCRHFSVVAEDRERELKEETSLQKVQDDAP